MNGSSWDSKPKRDLKVLVVSLPRTGTASMAEALTILGYKDVLHGTLMLDWKKGWDVISRGADASFPALPTYTGKPLTRAQWDEVWGRSEAVTDLAGLFATQLIPLYPEAKVILTVRDFEKWKRSIETPLRMVFSPVGKVVGLWVEPVFGSGVIAAIHKAILGSFASADADEALRNARVIYDAHHRRIRELVDPGRLLEYRLGQGWQPLCDFLDRPVPRTDFPWLNDAENMASTIRWFLRRTVARAALRLVPLFVAVVALAAYWIGRTG